MPRRNLASPPFRSAVRDLSVFFVLGLAALGCHSDPDPVLGPDAGMDSGSTSIELSEAPFPAWHQGFEKGVEGWFDAGTPGDLGWCGSIAPGTRGSGPVAPSAGHGYAKVAGGPCNAFWSGLGVPFGAPYAPGPARALYSATWPRAGYVTELDVYLDPAWSGAFTGTFSPGSLVQYAATIFPRDPDAEPFHTGPHYIVTVDAVPGRAALSVLGQEVTEAGWYTFRFRFDEVEGRVRAGFDLRARNGRTLASVSEIAPVELLGPVQVPFSRPLLASEYGSGHVWFFDIAFGLELAIDEHRVRPGR